MTRTNIIAEKKKRLEREKNRLREKESYIKQLERKARTRKLIEMGGLVAKAELGTLPPETLLGGLLSLHSTLNKNDEIIEQWAQSGKEAFSEANKGKTPVIVTFKEKPDRDIRTTIRSLGLKYNPYRKEWQGHVPLPELEKSLTQQKAEVKVLG